MTGPCVITYTENELQQTEPSSLCRIKNALLQNFAIINSVLLLLFRWLGRQPGQDTCNFPTLFKSYQQVSRQSSVASSRNMTIYDLNVLDNNKPKYHGNLRALYIIIQLSN